MKNLITLARVKKRSGKSLSNIVIGFDGDEELVIRLQELGIHIGSEISLIGRAPFRGPWLLRLGTTVVALRDDEALCLQLEENV